MLHLQCNTLLQGGKYRIVRVLGQGGFGITYLAEHTMLDKLVAIKEFFPKDFCDRDENTSHLTIGTKNSADIVAMLKAKFIKEARNISKLRHPNIITIHDIFQENDTAYYVMEFIEGASLSEIIKSEGTLSESEALGYIRKVADAVGYMHSLTMNHLDLKPANIMIRQDDGEPILIDFGLSKQYDASGGQTSTTPVGISHGYAPIEQYRPGGVATFTPQTDIYALGATLYALLTGATPPHYSDILEVGLPELPSSVSMETASAIEKAMEIKKINRPESVKEFLMLLPGIKNVDSKAFPTPNYSAEEKDGKSDQSQSKYEGNPINPSIEETVILNSQLTKTNKTALYIGRQLTCNFIDIGLSVKWSDRFMGASNQYEIGTSFTVGDFDLRDKISIMNIPSENQIRELIEECVWEPRKIGRSIVGFKVKGPNGNTIYFPFVNIQSSYQRVSRSEWQAMKKTIYFPAKEEIEMLDFPCKCKIDTYGPALTNCMNPEELHLRLISS